MVPAKAEHSDTISLTLLIKTQDCLFDLSQNTLDYCHRLTYIQQWECLSWEGNGQKRNMYLVLSTLPNVEGQLLGNHRLSKLLCLVNWTEEN